MKITNKGSVYYAITSQDDQRFVGSGWKWLGAKKCWMTVNIQRVIPFLEFCDAPAREAVETWLDGRASAIAASVASTSSLSVPAPEGLTYRPYQLAGTEFMLARHSSLNADVPRLGKTIQSLGVVNAYAKQLKVLVLCPAIAKTNWCKEAEKWLVHKGSVGYCDGKENPKTDFLVCNYDILSNHIEYLEGIEWDVIVADEAHYLKNSDALRTKCYMRLQRPKLHAIFLTGTPIFVRPIDIWTVVKLCDPQGIGKNWYSFTRRYCAAKKLGFGYDTSGASHEEELQYKMRKAFMVRREKSDVLTEIPTARNTIYLPKHGLVRLLDREKTAVQKGLASLLKALELENPEGIQNFSNLDGRDEMEVGPLATVRRELAMAKLDMVVKHCEEVLTVEKKLVVFAHHREVTLELAKRLDAACVIGGLSTKKRDEQIAAFKTGDKRTIVGNMTSMGVAISLAEADYAVFAELGWIPAEIDQCEERIWDPTKTNGCTIDRLVIEDSLEAAIARVLEKRQDSIDRLTQAKYLTGLVC